MLARHRCEINTNCSCFFMFLHMVLPHHHHRRFDIVVSFAKSLGQHHHDSDDDDCWWLLSQQDFHTLAGNRTCLLKRPPARNLFFLAQRYAPSAEVLKGSRRRHTCTHTHTHRDRVPHHQKSSEYWRSRRLGKGFQLLEGVSQELELRSRMAVTYNKALKVRGLGGV